MGNIATAVTDTHRSFPPEATEAVALGFDLAWEDLLSLNFRPGPLADSRRTRYVLAKIVLDLARSGMHDPEHLSRRSVRELMTTLPPSVRRRLSEACRPSHVEPIRARRS